MSLSTERSHANGSSTNMTELGFEKQIYVVPTLPLYFLCSKLNIFLPKQNGLLADIAKCFIIKTLTICS